MFVFIFLFAFDYVYKKYKMSKSSNLFLIKTILDTLIFEEWKFSTSFLKFGNISLDINMSVGWELKMTNMTNFNF